MNDRLRRFVFVGRAGLSALREIPVYHWPRALVQIVRWSWAVSR